MKEIITDEIKGLTIWFPDIFDEIDSKDKLKDVLEETFPEHYKLWAREIVGGNDGIHKIND